MTTYELINLYLDEMSVSLVPSSLNYYRSILTDFARDSGTTADRTTLIQHIKHLKEQNCNNTVRTKITIIKGFIKWAKNNGYYPTDFGQNIKLPTPEKKVTERMTKNEVHEMITNPIPKGMHNTVRNKAIMELAIITASRVSALCNLRRSDIDLDKRVVRFRHTKRNKEIELPLTESVCKTLEEYIETVRPDTLDDDDYLFVGERTNKDGNYIPLSRQQVYNITKAITKNACGRALSPHKLRHTSATIMIESGKLSIDEISQNLGHNSVATTQRYAQRLNDNPRKVATAEVFEDLF